MKKYICTKCNYRFCSEQLKQNICPYCGKKESVESEKSASDLLDEVGDFE